MKIKFNIGEIKATMNVTSEHHREGGPTDAKKEGSLSIGATTIEFECEAGELPAICKEMAPMVKDIVRAVTELNKQKA